MKRWFMLLPLLLLAASEPIVIDTKSHAVKPSSPSVSAPADFDFTGRTVIGIAGGGGGAPARKFDVKTYGAVGDGVTDDTTAIQNALTAIPSSGGVLYFPAGRYLYSGTGLTLSKPVTVEGDGGGVEASSLTDSPSLAVTTIDLNSATTTLFTVTTNGCSFKNLELRNTSSSAPTSGAGIAVTSGGDRTSYENITVNGFYTDIDVQAGWMQTWNGCYIVAPVLYGLKLRNVANPDYGDHSISNCQFLTAKSRAATSAIRIESGGGVKIVNTKINSMAVNAYPWGNGIDLAILTSLTTSDLLVSNCSIENFSGYGITGTIATGSAWYNVLITGNQIAPSISGTQTGISFAATSGGGFNGVSITGNYGLAYNGTVNPLISLSNCSNVTLTGNGQQGFSDVVTIGTGITYAKSATVPVGGTTGQVLSKNSNTNYDTIWTAATGGAPGLPNGSVQYNNGGSVFGGSTNFMYDPTNSIITLQAVSAIAPYYAPIVIKGTSSVDAAVALESKRLSTTQDWYFGSGSGAAINTNYFRIVDLTTSGDVLDIHNDAGHEIGLYGILGWAPNTGATTAAGTLDTAITRNAAGILEINNGTAGTFADLKLRNLTISGTCTGCGGGGGAPTTSKYILETADAALTNAFALGTLSTGILKNTTTTGVPTIATAKTDYWDTTLFTNSSAGLVPNPGGTGTAVKFLREDAAWGIPTAAAGGSTTQVQYNNGGALGGITNVTTDGTNITIAGDPVGVQFTKHVNVNLQTAGTTLLYTPPVGKTCLVQGFFFFTTAHSGTETTHPAVRLENGAASVVVPVYTFITNTEALNAAGWQTATTNSFAVTNASPLYVNVTVAGLPAGNTQNADIIAELMIY